MQNSSKLNNSRGTKQSAHHSLLTADEELQMKKDMLETYKDAGLMDNLKANLRKQIVEKLQIGRMNMTGMGESMSMASVMSAGVSGGEVKQQKSRFLHKTHRIYGHLIADYLRTYEVNFTYGVLLPEMRLNSGQLLLRDEICESFNIEKQEYANLEASQRRLSALEVLVDTIKKTKVKKNNIQVQTDNFDKARGLTEQLDNVNQEYMPKLDYFKLVSNKSQEEPFNKFRKECEERYKKEMEIEIDRIKRVEIMELRNIEAHRYQEKLNVNRQELDKKYNEKLAVLKEREKDLLEMCSRKLDDLENKSFENRQRHLFDIEGLRKKEMEYRRHSCLNSPEVKEERERLKRTEEMLKQKIRDLELLRQGGELQAEQDFTKRREYLRQDQKNNDARSREIEAIMAEEQEFLRVQKERMRDLEFQIQVLKNDNEALHQNITELLIEFNKIEMIFQMKEQQQENNVLNQALNAVQDDSSKELHKMRENNRRLNEDLEDANEKLQNIQKERDILEKKEKGLQEENNKKKHQAEQLSSARRQIQNTYEEDMVRQNLRLSETEQCHKLELALLREQEKDLSKILLKEKNELQERNNLLDSEVSNLKREMKYQKKRLQELEEMHQAEVDNKNLDQNSHSSISAVRNTNQNKKYTSPTDILDSKYRNNLDEIFKEMQLLKEKADQELFSKH